MADDYSSYFPISIGIGYNYAKTEADTINGMKVVTVVEADLQEISVLSKDPAFSSTYARVASWKTCNNLKEDYELGRFTIVGNFVSLHRKTMAHENGGVVKYSHRTSSYDRAADKFTDALQRLSQHA